MMYFLLILFFGSLLGITFMIGRKLIMIQNGEILHREEAFSKVPYLEELRHLTIKNIKKHGYVGLVATIRLYIRTSNLLKNKYQEVKTKIKNRNNEGVVDSEKKEISKFLKIISDYKQRVREIKHKIKEEEKNL